MSLKDYLVGSYGAAVYEKTVQLKKLRTLSAKSKNQSIFLQRCVSYKLLPRSFRINCPSANGRMMNIMERYRFELLICAKNDACKLYFKSISKSNQLQSELSQILSPPDMQNLVNAIEVAREKCLLNHVLELSTNSIT